MTEAFSSALFGSAMPLTLTWADMAVRLASSVIAGAIIGYNRTEHGKPAGLRTTLLVCLAASIAMLQMNYLLTLSGRPTDSFVMNDLMRLPLGILKGLASSAVAQFCARTISSSASRRGMGLSGPQARPGTQLRSAIS
jgi:hypothetical protein